MKRSFPGPLNYSSACAALLSAKLGRQQQRTSGVVFLLFFVVVVVEERHDGGWFKEISRRLMALRSAVHVGPAGSDMRVGRQLARYVGLLLGQHEDVVTRGLL